MKLAINYPIFEIKQPSTGKNLNFRRYLVKEEKILLFAKQSEEFQDIIQAIKQIVQLCCLEENFDVDEIPLFDLEYFYLKLRAASVNNIEILSITDKEDNQKYDIPINFDLIEIKFPKDVIDKNIKIDENIVIVMKYPAASVYNDKNFKDKLKKEGLFHLVLSCIDKVYNKDELIEMTPNELIEFVDNLDMKAYKKIEAFLVSMPSINENYHYTNSRGTSNRIEFNSLIDFFLYL